MFHQIYQTEMKRYLKLFENCHITRGYKRSVIVDVQRDKLYFIPNALANLFNSAHVFSIQNEQYNTTDQKVIDEYIELLVENELCFYCDEDLLSSFPVVDISSWDYPAKINNVIIETGRLEFSSSYQILKELVTEGCRHFEIFFYDELSCEEIDLLLSQLDMLDAFSYNIICKLRRNEDVDRAVSVLNTHYKIFRGIIYDIEENKLIESDKQGWGNIFLLKGEFSYNKCGVADHNYFCTSIEHISESQGYNTCLNRKVFIDRAGHFKNCPNMHQDFGSFEKIKLNSLLHNEEFTKLWLVKKNEIKVCKDCEFRDICTDCRAFLEDPSDIYSKPLKCGYNPYTNTWSDWMEDPLKIPIAKHYCLPLVSSQRQSSEEVPIL